jgi:nitrate reductase gamma subunit
MSGIVWHIFTFGVIGIFLLVITYRMLTIIRLPIHLRWELAPIPHEKGKGRYGGSYLEEYEWWDTSHHRSRIAPVIYMVKEIFLLRGVWKHNRALWPFSFSLHIGIYLVIAAVFLHVVNAVLVMAHAPLYILAFSRSIASVFAFGGYLLGSLGAISLMLKRALDPNLRPFSTFSTYVNLLFLCALFVSGGYAWLHAGDFASDMSLFVQRLMTFNSEITVAFPLSLHIVISLLFIVYLPLTHMIHFIAKYFTYHGIRWDDKPLDEQMGKEVNMLLAQPVTWSAPHAKTDKKTTSKQGR